MPTEQASLKISVITPTLNQGAFLKETISSFRLQEYLHRELIVIDGGSTDDTLSILKENQDILQWESIPGLGQSGAINHGWAQAAGDVLCWLNSDDLLLPGALGKVASFFSTNPDIEIIYGDCNYIDGNGVTISKYPSRAFDYKRLVSKAIDYIPQPSTFIRREVFETIGGVNEGLSFVMDFDYWMRAGLYFEFQHLPELLSKLRLHSGAKSIAKLSKFAHELTSVYEAYFSRSDLPPQIHSLKRKGLRNAYFVAAHYCYWAGEFAQARRYAMKGWRQQPFHPTTYMPIYFMGSLGFKLISRLKKNPYTKGLQ